MRRPPEALGELLILLRTRARMSQRELARASGVSYTQIGDLERGTGGSPSPITLRSLAKGLALDEFNADVGFDPIRADAFYRQLMEAAGYLGGLPLDAPPKRTGEEDVLEYLAARSGDTAVSEQLVRLAEKYPELAPEDQMVIRRLVGTWLRDP